MAAWQKGGGAAPAANGAKETPHLTVTTQSKKAEVGISTLIGDYVERGTNHGKKYYQKAQKIEGHEDIKVFLYYWDARDGADFSGWWFGDQLGGSQVWARSPSHTPSPPRVGWKIPWDAPKAELGALFVDPYKPGASAVAAASAAAAAAGAAAAGKAVPPGAVAGTGKTISPPGKVQNQTIAPPGRGGTATPAAAAGTATAAAGANNAARVQRATEQIEEAETAANEALSQAKLLLSGEANEETMKQVQELLQKQLTMLTELPKSLMADINEVKKSGWAGNSAVSDISKLIPKARTLQATLTSEINKVKAQVAKQVQAAATAKKTAELKEAKKKAEENDAKDMAESLPEALELVTGTEEAVEAVSVMADPMVADPPAEGDDLKKAMDEVEKAAAEAQNKLIEARKQTNAKLQAARKYTPEVQKKAVAEFTTMQQKLTEAQKKLNPYKTFRQSFKARVEAKKGLADMSDKMDEAELEVEKASLMTSAADQGQMSEDEVSSAEKLVAPATMAISNAIRNLDMKLRTADGGLKDELTQMKERGVAAKKKIEAVSAVLKRQREGLALQVIIVLASERVEQAEEALQKCHEAETPFLKGLEVLPPDESANAITACEAAATKADSAINGAKLFVKGKLAEAAKKSKEAAKVSADELKAMSERAEEAAKKLQAFKNETLERKTAARLSDVMDKVTDTEAKVQALVKICEVFESENLEEVSTEALQEAADKAGGAEKEASDACLEARKALASKQKESKPDMAVAISKLQARLTAGATEVGKQKKAAELGARLIKGKTVISEQEDLIKEAEDEVEKVQKVVDSAPEGELSDDAVRELGQAVVSSQKTLKTSLTCLNQHLPGAVPAVKAALQKLVERSKKAQEKLNSVLAATKDQREKVLAEAYIKEGQKKAEEVEEAMERVNRAELPFLKGLEFLPHAEAAETLKECDAAAAATQKAIGEARTYIASKNLEVKQFKEDVSKPAAEEFGKMSERINATAGKLSQFRKDTEGRKKTAQMQEASVKIDTIESEGKRLAEAVEPFSKGEVEEMSIEESYELCTKLLSEFKGLYEKMDEARVFIAARQKDAKGTASQVESLQKLQSRLSDARMEVAKSKTAVSDREQKITSKKLLAEASEMVERLEEEVKQATEFCAPLLDKGGERFLVAASVQKLAACLRDHMGEKDLTPDAIFGQISGEADGKVPKEAFLAYLEGLPTALDKEELTVTEERRLAVFKHLETDGEGSVSLASFQGIFTTRYVCVKGVSVTDGFEVATSTAVSKIEPEDVLEALGNPKLEQATGMTRVECKILNTDKSGFVTMVGNGGTVYIEVISPFKTFVADMDKKIAETVESANKVAAFFKTKSAELATSAGKPTPMAEARQELVKLRVKVTTATGNLEKVKQKAAMAKKDYPKREQLDKDAHIEIREKKVSAAIQTEIDAKTEAMEECVKKLEEAAAPLTGLKGAEREAFATPASLQREVDTLSAAAGASVSAARVLREEQLAKVGKAVRGPFVDIKRELQKLELKAASTLKKCTTVVDSVRTACQSIVDSRYAKASQAVREEVRRKGLTNEGLFEELLKSGEERVSEEAFCERLRSLEGLDLEPEHAMLLCRSIEADGIGKRKFLAFVQQFYLVVKVIAITDEFDVGTAKIQRNTEVDEVIEVLEGPMSHEKLGLTRIRGKSLADGAEGWITVRGNQGTPYLNKVMRPCCQCTKEVSLEREFKNEGDDEIRKLKVDEVLELVEGPRKETFAPGLRVRGKACKDGAMGWFTVRDKKGVEHAEADNKYYTCITSVAMTDEQDIKTCNVLRKLDKGELFLALAEPTLDESAGITRLNGKASKDGKTGWITIKGNAGTTYAEQSNKYFTVLREMPLQKAFPSAKSQAVRQLEEGEALQALEGPKEETYPPEVRLKGRALSDGTVGWITKADNVKPWSPYYKCLEATPMHSAQSPEGAEVVRRLETGETVELLDGPVPEGSEMRMRGRAEKDRAVGWVTIRNAAGKKVMAS